MHAPLTDLGRHPAYRSLYAAAAVLERFMSAHTREIGLRQIIAGVQFAEADVRKACRSLSMAGLIMPGSAANRWMLAADPGKITLADVWSAITASNAGSKPMLQQIALGDSKTGMLVTQALLSVEQQLIAHLSRFHLDTASHAQTGFQYVNYRARRNIRFSPPVRMAAETSAFQTEETAIIEDALQPA
ncbi:hypothetical protein [Undibacterium sp.]|uniref:hypothetical protein n=1 Tax=Undibacterium sp. TaxID=1914977 RepID=UPI00374DDE2E